MGSIRSFLLELINESFGYGKIGIGRSDPGEKKFLISFNCFKRFEWLLKKQARERGINIVVHKI